MKNIHYNEEKRTKLLAERGIDLHIVAHIINDVGVVDRMPNTKRKGQIIYVIMYEWYCCAVPVVENDNEIFIKTAYLSRKLKKIYY